MNKTSLKKNLLTTASAFAITAFAASGAVAADRTSSATPQNFVTDLSGVTGDALIFGGDHTVTIDDGINLGDGTGTSGVSVDTGATDRGTLIFSGTSNVTDSIGQAGAGEQVTLVTLAGDNTKTVTFNEAIFAEGMSFTGDATALLKSGKGFTDGAIASGAIVATGAGTTGRGTLTLEGGAQTIKGQIGTSTDYIKVINAGAASATSTFTGDVFAATINATGAGAIALNGDTTAGTVEFASNDATITLADDKNLVATSITATGAGTAGDGTIALAGTNARLLSGEIGTATDYIKAISFTGANAATTNGNLYVANIDFNDQAAELIVASGKNIAGNVIDSASGKGTLTFSGTTNADSTITGKVGTDASNDINVLNFIAGDSDSVLTLNGSDNFVTTTNIGAGQVALNGNLTGAVTFAAAAGTSGAITLADDVKVTGAINNADDNEGIITVTADAEITGDIGATGGANDLNLLTVNAGTLTLGGDNWLEDANFAGDGTITVADNKDFHTVNGLTATTTNNGTIQFLGTNAQTLTGDVGTSTKSIKLLSIDTTNTLTTTGNIYATNVTFEGTDDGTVTIADTKNVTAAFTTDTTNTGTVELLGTSTVTGNIGATDALIKEFKGGAAGDVAKLVGNLFATTLTVSGTGEVDLDGTFNGTTLNFSAAGTVTVSSGNNIVAAVTTDTSNTGTLTFEGNSTLSNSVGTATDVLNTVNVEGGTVTASKDINAGVVNVKSDARLELTGTGVTHEADIVLAGTSTIDINGNAVTLANTNAAVDGNVTFGANTTLAATVTGGDNNDSGKLTAAGTVDFNNGGNIYITVDSTENVAAGKTYDLVSAATLSNAGSVAITDNSHRLSFSGAATATTYTVTTAVANKIGSGTTNTNLSNAGTQFEAASADSGTSAADVTFINTYNALADAAATNAALEKDTPRVNGETNVAVTDVQNASLGTVTNRLYALRDSKSGIATGSGYRDIGLWGQVFGRAADQGDRDGVKGYQSDTLGGAIGIDGEFGDNLTVGFAGSYANTDVDGFSSDSEIDSFQGTLYASKQAGKRWYDALIGVGFNDMDTDRTLSTNNTVNGSTDGYSFTGKFTAGYDFKVQGPLQFTPRGSLQYTLVTWDSYTETGAGGALNIDTEDNNSFVAGLGFDLAYPITHSGVSYLPSLSFTYLYDFIGDEVETTSSLSSASAFAFNSEGADIAQSTFQFGAGLDVMARDDITISVGYELTEREDYQAHTGSLKARLAF